MDDHVTRATAARRRMSGLCATRDGGLTLIEVVVAMSIMTVVGAMFTASVLQLFRSASFSEAASTAQSQVNIAFLRLDKEIRYAAAVSTPGSVGSDSYIEFLTSYTGTPVCTELRLHVATRQLQRRTWIQGSSPLAPSAWIPLASSVSSPQPFTFTAADATFNYQRLRLQLVATSGSGGTATPKQSDITFTALNTSLATSSATTCTEGRAVP
jgi:prepilin-type N-terminal cleavage/methylation domain-containing protein